MLPSAPRQLALLAIAVCLLTSCPGALDFAPDVDPPPAAPSAAVSSDPDGVRTVVNAYAETWNRHDADALAALFTSDADFVQVAGRRWSGRAALRANVAFLHGTSPPDSVPGFPPESHGMFRSCTYRFDRVDVRFLNVDVALAHVAWTQFGDPRFEKPRRGLLSFVVVRDGGHWQLAAGHNTARP